MAASHSSYLASGVPGVPLANWPGAPTPAVEGSFGAWDSPITASFITSSSIGLSALKSVPDGALLWLETRPQVIKIHLHPTLILTLDLTLNPAPTLTLTLTLIHVNPGPKPEPELEPEPEA